MAKLISVEKSQYINRNIGIYSQNKIGEYSKYLDKTPVFVTYFHINTVHSHADVGTGGIESEIGSSSPVRFDRILNFPIYNIPELRPDVNYDESGYDIQLDLNDLTILPRTLKPIPGSYFLLSFPGIKDFLFRVNSFRYTTIQSNDFYSIDADLKHVGLDLERMVLPQVVNTYQTIFENIGTESKCFLLTTDIDQVNAVAKAINDLRDTYKELYYDRLSNSFLTPFGLCNVPGWLFYDMYLEKFIIDSEIYYDDTSSDALVLSPQEMRPPDFELTYRKSIYGAVIRRDIRLLAPYMYCYFNDIRKIHSIFRMYNMEVKTVTLVPSNVDRYPSSGTGEDIVRCGLNGTYPFNHVPSCFDLNDNSKLADYIGKDLIDQIKKEYLISEDSLDRIIYHYLMNLQEEIDTNQLMNRILTEDYKTFIYTPIVIYILIQRYNDYFRKEKGTEQL